MVSTPICVSPQTLSHSSISPLLPSPIYPHFLTLIVSIFSCPCCPWEGKMTPSVRLIIARHHRTRASLLYLQTKMKTNGPRCWCTLGLWGKKKKKEWGVRCPKIVCISSTCVRWQCELFLPADFWAFTMLPGPARGTTPPLPAHTCNNTPRESRKSFKQVQMHHIWCILCLRTCCVIYAINDWFVQYISYK